MIEIMQDLPENVIGITVSGVLTGEDYEDVLVPAIEDKAKKYEKISILYQLGEKFEGFTDKAMLEDAKLIQYITKFEKVAVVSDVDWIVNAVKLFRFVLPWAIRTYSNEELSEAKTWISE